jgi:hypothetical protein
VKRGARRTAISGLLIAAVLCVGAGPAGASPAWKFNGSALGGTELLIGRSTNFDLTIPGLTIKCGHVLFLGKIENSAGTGKGEITYLPLFECSTNSKFCTIEVIGASALPWPLHLTTVTSSNYVVLEKVSIEILIEGEECALGGIVAKVTGSAGGLYSNVNETITFNSASFTATGTSLKALGSKVELNAVFDIEAFGPHLLDSITI